MDFFYDDLPSTSHEDPPMTEDRDHNSSRGKSPSIGVNKFKEQHTSSSIDDISRRAQELVKRINDSRTSDQKVFDSFQEKSVEKVTEMCQQMKEHMYTCYEENSNGMQEKLQELSEVLGQCSKLCSELLDASQALESLRGGLAISGRPEPL
ncbi:synaptonemal complex central element protein 2 [Plectropomus leopardus]|uniref:synaptonemal complex central element protein 2 n=1 Tax=Plectropomus leopardus TaxID=160734 RepID=UPI001C4D976F|nr:synaptonemal complex central element protein 2 [Plectropomus leopardus]XP_042341157.1 synaptonemal complex central element protein 2 [Plectropomus leopardus]XP_042341158.1 synaptonemal complex central element protein 2 [Plectropomus leopardus]